MTDVFNQENNEANQSNEQSVFDTMVGEGKKFSDSEALAKGKEEADRFINQLQEELKGLRGELDKRLTAEEVLDKIRENNARQPEPKEPENTSPSLSKEDVAAFVQEHVSNLTAEQQVKANLDTVNKTMVEKFGTKAGEQLKIKADELGVSVGFLKDTASKSPKAFFSVIGMDTKTTTTQQTSGSTVNAEALGHKGIVQGSPEYYANMRKENPSAYWSAKVQNEIFEAKKKELGM